MSIGRVAERLSIEMRFHMIWHPCPSDALAGERAEEARTLLLTQASGSRGRSLSKSRFGELRRIDLEERAIACRRGPLKIQEEDYE